MVRSRTYTHRFDGVSQTGFVFPFEKLTTPLSLDNLWRRYMLREIRIRDASGIYRVMYVAKFEEAIYVLHCFQKKTQVTGKQDKAIAAVRYRAALNARKEKK